MISRLLGFQTLLSLVVYRVNFIICIWISHHNFTASRVKAESYPIRMRRRALEVKTAVRYCRNFFLVLHHSQSAYQFLETGYFSI